MVTTEVDHTLAQVREPGQSAVVVLLTSHVAADIDRLHRADDVLDVFTLTSAPRGAAAAGPGSGQLADGSSASVDEVDTPSTGVRGPGATAAPAILPSLLVELLLAGHDADAIATLLGVDRAVVEAESAALGVVPAAPRATAPMPGSAADRPAPAALIVDDDTGVRLLVANHLGIDGWNVHTAADGVAAVAMTADRPFDLVVLDLALPGLHGLDVLDRLRAAPAHRDMAVVVISGTDDPDAERRCLAGGADAFLAKPFSLARLDEVTTAALDARASLGGG